MNLDKLSVAAARGVAPWLDETIRRRGPRNYNEFVEQLYDDLQASFADLERQARNYTLATEDQITNVICHGLRCFGYIAQHDVDSSGHVDISVSAPQNKYMWMGEAKRFKS